MKIGALKVISVASRFATKLAQRRPQAPPDAVKADHRFNTNNRSFRDLVSIMTSYDQSARQDFLQFITGSPKLPIGGEFTSESVRQRC